MIPNLSSEANKKSPLLNRLKLACVAKLWLPLCHLTWVSICSDALISIKIFKFSFPQQPPWEIYFFYLFSLNWFKLLHYKTALFESNLKDIFAPLVVSSNIWSPKPDESKCLIKNFWITTVYQSPNVTSSCNTILQIPGFLTLAAGSGLPWFSIAKPTFTIVAYGYSLIIYLRGFVLYLNGNRSVVIT